MTTNFQRRNICAGRTSSGGGAFFRNRLVNPAQKPAKPALKPANPANPAKASGFTIIEVALVLAIAGLIFLVVFLALPALQRSQRDTAKKQDVARVVAAIQSFKANNAGATLCPGADHLYVMYTKTPGDYPLQQYLGQMAMIDQVYLYGCDDSGQQWIIGDDYYNPNSSGYYRIEIGPNRKCDSKTDSKIYNTAASAGSYAVMARLDQGSSDGGAWNYICENA